MSFNKTARMSLPSEDGDLWGGRFYVIFYIVTCVCILLLSTGPHGHQAASIFVTLRALSYVCCVSFLVLIRAII